MGGVAEVSRILRVRLKTGLYDDLTHRAIAAGYASLADWARYLLIQAGKGEVGSKALETEPPGVEAEQALVTPDDGEPVRSISEPEPLSGCLSPTSSTGGDATVTVAPEPEGVDLSPSSGEGLSTESDELASLLAGMGDFSPEG